MSAPRKRGTEDNLSEDGAHRLAGAITTYWRERGAFTVKTRITQFRATLTSGNRDHLDTRFAVRSNMVGGLPPK